MCYTTRVCQAFVGTLLLSVVCGCADNDQNVVGNPRLIVIEREVDLDGKQVVVILFKDADHGYFESFDGSELSEGVAGQMRRHLPKTRFVSAMEVLQKLQGEPPKVLNETFSQRALKAIEQIGQYWAAADKLQSASPQELGEAVRADVVLLGTLKEFSTQEPKTTGMLRGTCRIELELYDVTRKQTIWSQSLTVTYPERGVGIPSIDTTPEKIREELMKLASDTIAKKFYTHKDRRKQCRIPPYNAPSGRFKEKQPLRNH